MTHGDSTCSVLELYEAERATRGIDDLPGVVCPGFPFQWIGIGYSGLQWSEWCFWILETFGWSIIIWSGAWVHYAIAHLYAK